MKRRILLTTLLVATIAVVAFGVPLGIVVRHQYRNEAILQLERHTIEAALTIDNGSMEGSDLAELPLIAGTKLALYRPDGTRITGDGPTTGGELVAVAASNRVADLIGDDGIIVTVPIVSNEQVIGVLRGERGPSAFETRIWRAWMVMSGLALSSVIVAGLVASRLARRLSRPLDRVHDAAMRLGDGDFTVSVEPSGIVELDDVATALASTAVRLGNQIARERTFSADASHQLRTPLTGLRLVLETEREFPRQDPQAIVEDALHEVDRLERTIDDLLRLARNAQVDRRPLDVATMLHDVERRWHGRVSAAGRRIVVNVDDVDEETDNASPRASAAAVANIVDVLVDNAVRHGRGIITLSTRHIDGGVSIGVSDEGGDMSVAADDVFERRQRMFSAGDVTERPHGIGLALARSLADAEGGRLQLAATRPSTRFELVLSSNGGTRQLRADRQPPDDKLDSASVVATPQNALVIASTRRPTVDIESLR